MPTELPPNPSAQKRLVRQQLLARRAKAYETRPLDLADRLSEEIIGFAQTVPTTAKRVRVAAGYVPMGTEIDVLPALQALAAQGWLVVMPCVEARHSPLVWRFWQHGDPLACGPSYAPVRHPLPSAPLCDLSLIDLVVTPLVGVDDQGVRMGYGGGYYDRSVPQINNARRACDLPPSRLVGACFDAQRVAQSLPCEPHDLRVHSVATGAGTWAPQPTH